MFRTLGFRGFIPLLLCGMGIGEASQHGTPEELDD